MALSRCNSGSPNPSLASTHTVAAMAGITTTAPAIKPLVNAHGRRVGWAIPVEISAVVDRDRRRVTPIPRGRKARQRAYHVHYNPLRPGYLRAAM
jgi:hypothetical protein